MATIKSDGMAEQIQKYIEAGLAREVKKIADQHKEEIARDVENAMSDIVARLSTRLIKYYRVEDMQDEIRITVAKEFVAPNKDKDK